MMDPLSSDDEFFSAGSSDEEPEEEPPATTSLFARLKSVFFSARQRASAALCDVA